MNDVDEPTTTAILMPNGACVELSAQTEDGTQRPLTLFEMTELVTKMKFTNKDC